MVAPFASVVASLTAAIRILRVPLELRPLPSSVIVTFSVSPPL
jgi:hypothetical protein